MLEECAYDMIYINHVVGECAWYYPSIHVLSLITWLVNSRVWDKFTKHIFEFEWDWDGFRVGCSILKGEHEHEISFKTHANSNQWVKHPIIYKRILLFTAKYMQPWKNLWTSASISHIFSYTPIDYTVLFFTI